MLFFRQLGVLIKKDLLVVAVRGWIGTLLSALLFPVVLTIVLCEIKNWTAPSGLHGVGNITPIKSFADALLESGGYRPTVVLVKNGYNDGAVGSVVQHLSTIIRDNGKELHTVDTYGELLTLCPSSNAGVSGCYGAVEWMARAGFSLVRRCLTKLLKQALHFDSLISSVLIYYEHDVF